MAKLQSSESWIMSRRQAQIRSERESREREGRRWSLDVGGRSDVVFVRRTDVRGKVDVESVLIGRSRNVKNVVTDLERWNMLERCVLKGRSAV
jgi:hypothetical protein